MLTGYTFSHIRDTDVSTPGWTALIVSANIIIAWVLFLIPTKEEVAEYGEEDDGDDVGGTEG